MDRRGTKAAGIILCLNEILIGLIGSREGGEHGRKV